MREFAVTLRCGLKFVVKADRVVMLDRQFLALTQNPVIGESEGETIALFDRGQVMAVVARDHLVSEEQTDLLANQYYADTLDATNDGIPF